MLIRTQDKDGLLNFDNFQNIEINENRNDYVLEAISQNSCEWHLGKYSSQGKAFKVMDMICNAYKCDGAVFTIHNAMGESGVMSSNAVFEMPKDEEVKDG